VLPGRQDQDKIVHRYSLDRLIASKIEKQKRLLQGQVTGGEREILRRMQDIVASRQGSIVFGVGPRV